MKRHLLFFKKILCSSVIALLVGFGNVTVLKGIVLSIAPGKITVIQKNGSQLNLKINTQTQTFVSGRPLPATRIKPNSHVQIAVDRDDVCLQIVVEEAPK
jgi:hypothetical protein